MEPKVNYTLVGLFIASLGAAMLVGVLWLSQTDYRGVYERYYSYMDESVSGLSIDSYVKYHGVDVGRVKDIALSPENPGVVRLALDIQRGTPIKEDTVASLETQGLTGITIVSLSGGSRESPLLRPRPGENYPIIKSERSFYARLTDGLSQLMADEQLPALLTNLNSLAQEARGWVDAQSRADLKRILADLAQVTKVVAQDQPFDLEQITRIAARQAQLAEQGKTIGQRGTRVAHHLAEHEVLLLARRGHEVGIAKAKRLDARSARARRLGRNRKGCANHHSEHQRGPLGHTHLPS